MMQMENPFPQAWSDPCCQLSLTDDSKDLTTINMPKGLFRYTRLLLQLPMLPDCYKGEGNKLLHEDSGLL